MMRHLAEALKNLSKYPDRPIVDYWRTVQGTPVGFHGNPKDGAGIPIAGPPVLTGGSASGNPLLEPLLKKYPPKTFIGDAIRKKNFPLTAVNFIENFVGKDEKAIKARFAEMENRVLAFAFSKEEVAKAEKERTDALGKFVGRYIDDNGDKIHIPYADHWNNPVVFSKQNGKFVNSLPKNKEVQDYVDDLNKRGVGIPKPTEGAKVKDIDPDTYSEIYEKLFTQQEYSGAYEMMRSHFSDPSMSSSYLYKILQFEGVAGTFSSGDHSASIKDKEDLQKRLKSYHTDYDACKKFLGDLYVLNQIFMRARGKKVQKVTRGMGGNTIAGLGGNLESQKVVAEMVQNNVSMRFLSRPVSGFAEGATSIFKGWTVTSDIPAEAILSSTVGAKVQGNKYADEKEVLIIGAATLPFSPEQISFVAEGNKKYSSQKIADKISEFGSDSYIY
jgi:hypothetical protein